MFKVLKKTKVFAIITALALLAALVPGSLARASTPTIPALTKSAVFTIGSKTVTVDGTPYQMDVAPYIDSANRTQVPVRYLGDVLGMTAAWNAQTQTVNLDEQKFTATESLVIGSDNLTYVNGTRDGQTVMDTMPVIVPPGRTMLPARFVAQAVGYQVSWNPTARTVTVSPPGTPSGTVQGTGTGNDGGVGTGTGGNPVDTNNTVEPGGHSGGLAP